MSGQVLKFTNYSPKRYAALGDFLNTKGLHLEGNVGDLKQFGADVSYAYDGADTLTLLVRSAPHFHSMSGFVEELSKAVNGIPE